ncbi:hypothetical protein CLAFUW4_03688 [Fulvia fulva]|uniref:HOOK N-terminal domain-containing protein n=1 Tax=Passalora fulva TaxID=5499 RepID=A0A9Q8L991_PASFU|nr:uncharacterized protein CLAFUR5_03666 [Fulvia fulva]KAK4631325.1 hypothetical protein CLAFUR4_03676 [Fulvia fulva]KAK4632572.1 hypothetical protein CLAFUR0_03679 [Fulvia fulva]UJO13203.1 hypothetical protein CLAFUR5_03666 [Fulvia fulva]WPV10749.1 hypothetical protein CLAFUW4_03688 [Fulvia fulva]WPV26063.1 hypothetical protein CLAFUW7_03680 [Fulvia fulva]
MSSPEPDSLGDSLLAWVQSFEDGKQIETLGGLSDGKTLWAILQDVDPNFFSGSLPEPDLDPSSDWTRKWQNLKHLEKQLSIYYRDVCNEQNQAVGASTGPDLKAIAADGSVRDLEKLIMEIIRAAMASPESNQMMGKRLMGLGNEHAMVIAYEIRRMQEDEVTESETPSRDESAYQSEQEAPETPIQPRQTGLTDASGPKSAPNGDLFSDPLLEREEELLQAQATIEKLQASHREAQRQLQELRSDKEQLQEAFDAYRSDLTTKGRKATADDDFKKLQRQADSDRSYIEDLETQLQSSKDAVDNYERQIQRLKAENEANQKFKDDLQMMRVENEDLSQKVKANENLKKKIQALQEQEKATVTMREELKQAHEKLDELERMKQMQASLEKEIIEKKGLIRNQEYQINELTTTRKHAEYDARVLAQKLEAARERQDRDHEMIEEMRAKLNETHPDDEVDVEAPPKKDSSEEPEKKTTPPKPDDNKQWLEKVTLLNQQLEAADIRLKQAADRNAKLEEGQRGHSASTEEREKAERQLEERDATIMELRKQLETMAKEPKEAPPQDIAVLQRENRLMTTAWYDLSGRIRNNGVSLGRRRQEAKSWIGKQRQLVGPGSGVVHR